ncbi:hypothetical protein [Clostridium sp.]|uniref:hypothetical protein n=1 Tax=Clostridium sp. TaxID=1506 RepID=UPI001A41EAA0|nr:hypothetical protein [Clostridium sp.]MBK5234097.1 hypothetical protein [Clostridium sp.]
MKKNKQKVTNILYVTEFDKEANKVIRIYRQYYRGKVFLDQDLFYTAEELTTLDEANKRIDDNIYGIIHFSNEFKMIFDTTIINTKQSTRMVI